MININNNNSNNTKIRTQAVHIGSLTLAFFWEQVALLAPKNLKKKWGKMGKNGEKLKKKWGKMEQVVPLANKKKI